MSLESKVEVLAAAINRLCNILESKEKHLPDVDARPVVKAEPAPTVTITPVTEIIDKPVELKVELPKRKEKKEPETQKMPEPPVFETPAPVTPTPAKSGVPFTDAKGLVNYVMTVYQELGPEKGARIQEVINGLGCKVVNEIKPEQFEAFYQGVEALK